jgi:hypothetical protein
MRMTGLFRIAAAFNLLLGVLWLFYTDAMARRWGIEPDAVLLYALRRYCVPFFGFAWILWHTSRSAWPNAQRAVATGSLIVCAGLAAVSVFGVSQRTVAPGTWLSATIEGVLAACFALALFRRRRDDRR